MEPLRTSQTPSFGLKPILDFVDFLVLFLKNIFPNGGTLAPLGPPWAPMGPHGPPWGPMGPYGAPMGAHGVPWAPMAPHGAHGGLGALGPHLPPIW